jgi:hypothetical protein
MADKTKIIRKTVKVYIGAAGADTGTASNFTEVGWCEGGQTKLTEGERSTIPLDDDTDFKLSTKYDMNCVGLETDTAKITALETLEDGEVDILLVERDDLTKAYKLANMQLQMAPNFNYTKKDVNRINLLATRTAAKLTDFFTELTGLTGY